MATKTARRVRRGERLPAPKTAMNAVPDASPARDASEEDPLVLEEGGLRYELDREPSVRVPTVISGDGWGGSEAPLQEAPTRPPGARLRGRSEGGSKPTAFRAASGASHVVPTRESPTTAA